ncbi:MAG TPA: hypothetical protein VJL61_12165 [Rhodanobacteraceae bacterium]|nr:hypothetical protein [Rhodanobacteraceae bacterium]
MTRKKATGTPNSRRNIAHDVRTTIQVCNVPERIKRALASKAAAEGASLSAYLRAELETLAAWPSEGEVRARLEGAEPFGLRESSARIIRTARAERADTILAHRFTTFAGMHRNQ